MLHLVKCKINKKNVQEFYFACTLGLNKANTAVLIGDSNYDGSMHMKTI